MFIVRNFNVKSDIYILINLDEKDKGITQNIRESLSNEIVFLSDNLEVLESLKTSKFLVESSIRLNLAQMNLAKIIAQIYKKY